MIHEHFDECPLPMPMRHMHGKDATPHPDMPLMFPAFPDRCFGMAILNEQSQDVGDVGVSIFVKLVGDFYGNCFYEPAFDEPKEMEATVSLTNLTPGLEYRILRSREREL